MNQRINYKGLTESVITDDLTFVDDGGIVVDETELEIGEDGCVEVISIENEGDDIQIVVGFRGSVTKNEQVFTEELEDEGEE